MINVHEPHWQQQCEQEKLHLCGAIQSFGALLFVKETNFLVSHISANIHQYILPSNDLVLGEPFKQLGDISTQVLESLDKHKKTYFDLDFHPALFPLCVTVVRHQDGWLIEFEPNYKPSMRVDLDNIYKVIRDAATEHQLTRTLVDVIKSNTGFDRTMIYKFHEDWSGEVIAEAANSSIGSYLGLHFPASDIPEIARKLYEVNPWRYISDIHQTEISIHSATESAPIDLTYSELRGVSKMHIQYLANMQVQSSLSIAIVVFNRLWGLVVCHHSNPTQLARSIRSCCFDIVEKFRLALSERITRENLSRIDNTHRFVRDFFHGLPSGADDFTFLQHLHIHFGERLASNGMALINDHDILLIGTSLPSDTIQAIENHFCSLETGFWYTNKSNSVIADQPCIGVFAAGIAAIKIKRFDMKYRVYFFRTEKPYDIRWAGNPNKPSEKLLDGNLRITPRHSFETWVEEKRGESVPWSKSDIALISHFHMNLLKHLWI